MILQEVQKLHPNYYSELYRLLKISSNKYPDNVRRIYYLEQLTNLDKEGITNTAKENNISYLIDYYWDPKDKVGFILDQKIFKLIKHFTPLKKGFPQISIYNITFHILNESNQNFLFFINRGGPYIDVYKVYKLEQ